MEIVLLKRKQKKQEPKAQGRQKDRRWYEKPCLVSTRSVVITLVKALVLL